MDGETSSGGEPRETTDILISEVVIIEIFISLFAKAWNILLATPAWALIPLPTIDSFFNEQGYISSLSQTISDNRSEDSDFLLFSYHGIPNRHLLKTDPTKNHCLKVENCCDIDSDARPYCYKAQVYETSKLCANYLNLESSVPFTTAMSSSPILQVPTG